MRQNLKSIKVKQKDIEHVQQWLQGKSKYSIAKEMKINRQQVDSRLLNALKHLYERR